MTARDSTGGPAALLAAIRDPSRMRATPSNAAWEALLSCARRNGVLAYLASRAGAARVLPELPPFAQEAMVSAQLSAARIAKLALWELDRVRRVLGEARVPLLALKGVAYLLRGLPHAGTRRMADIDIMVPREDLAATEQAMLAAGWSFGDLDRYDERYYREWAHELPPLKHPARTLAVDVHHTICPPVSRLRPDARALWACAEAAGSDRILVLSPEDSVLHAAVHLFFDSDFDGRFRDLVDLHELVEAFGGAGREAFFDALVERARALGLGRPLYYALQALPDVLGTPVPASAVRAVRRFASAGPAAWWMRGTLRRVLTPIDPAPWPPPHRGRLWLLYVRAHWLRMPPQLLLPHLARKALRRGRYDAAQP